MADLHFTFSFRCRPPIVRLMWDCSRAGVRVVEKSGREILVGPGENVVVLPAVDGESALIGSEPHTTGSEPHTSGSEPHTSGSEPHTTGRALPDFDRRLQIPGGNEAPVVRNVRDLKRSPCGRYLAIFHDRTVDVWNHEKRKLVSAPVALEDVDDGVWRCSSQLAELTLVTRSGLVFWSADGVVGRGPEHCAPGTRLLWNRTGTYLAVADGQGSLSVWAPHINRTFLLAPKSDYPLRTLAWLSNDQTLAAGAAETVFIWNLEAVIHGNATAQIVHRLSAPLTCLQSRPCGSLLATGDFHGDIEIWRPARVESHCRSANVGSPVSHIAWSPNGNHLAAGTSCGGIYIARVRR